NHKLLKSLNSIFGRALRCLRDVQVPDHGADDTARFIARAAETFQMTAGTHDLTPDVFDKKPPEHCDVPTLLASVKATGQVSPIRR
ncbi:hypothetical protein, partial [Sphingomonas sp. CFBP 8760]|uniref:hypothetical protein n=1 Tax=Sphingomonas sp. CFBP 8760 TaxID=2775282 RepID=UPI001A90EB39